MKCPGCGKKVPNNYNFCPFCGMGASNSKKDKLEEKEFMQNFKNFEKSMKLPFFVKLPLKGMMKQLSKQIYDMEKQSQAQNSMKEDQERPKIVTQGFAINISSADGKPVIRIKQLTPGQVPGQNQQCPNMITRQPSSRKTKPIKTKDFNKDDAEKFSKFKKIEPKTAVRRLSDKIIYEIDIPDATKEKIIINNLENSIEIKALAKEKAYFKVIPVSFPIKAWNFEQGKLILELNPES